MIAFVVVFAASLVASYLMVKAMTDSVSASSDVDEKNIPTTKEGTVIPVLFGTRDLTSPVLSFYGKAIYDGFDPEKWLCLQYVFCHGMVDSIRRIKWGGKTIYSGNEGFGFNESLNLSILSKNLFLDGKGLEAATFTYRGSVTQNTQSALTNSTYNGCPIGYRRLMNSVILLYKDTSSIREPSLLATRIATRDCGQTEQWRIYLAYILVPERVDNIIESKDEDGNIQCYNVVYVKTDLLYDRTLKFDFITEPSYVGSLHVYVYNSSIKNDSTKVFDQEYTTSGGTKTIEIGLSADMFSSALDLYSGNVRYKVFTIHVVYDSSNDVHYFANTKFFMPSVNDMNPAHVIRECITDKEWGMGYNDDDIDDISFIYAATVMKNEGMGVSVKWSKSTSIEDFVKEILRHIDGMLYVDKNSGKFTLKLLRDDYNESELIILDKSNISSVTNWKRNSYDDLFNTVAATYYNTQYGCASVLTITDPALVIDHGMTIQKSIEYPAFSNPEIVSKAAQRDLLGISRGLASCDITTTYSAAGTLNIGDAFKVSYPEFWAATTVMRVLKISFGDGRNNAIKISCVQDVFFTPEVPFITG